MDRETMEKIQILLGIAIFVYILVWPHYALSI